VKILIIHNRYQIKGGEDTTFEEEVELLGKTEEIKTLIFKNYSGWKGAIQFLFSLWNLHSANKIKKIIGQFEPELVHVHNWHYAIGPIVIRSVHKRKIPVVLTIQNFRLLCPSATLLHQDSLFLDSIQAYFPWKAIQKKVYRNSFIQTFWLAFIIWAHKKMGTWKMVDRYILQTELAKSVFISSSLGTLDTQYSVKPNSIKDPVMPLKDREDYFLYIGRLSKEKGISTLLDTFKNITNDIYIGGDGPLKEEVIISSKKNSNIHYLGLLDKDTVMDMMSRCSALVFPSLWYEGMPLTLIEAFATGTPVIASNLGAMASMIQDGFNGIHFTVGNSVEFAEKIKQWDGLSTSNKKQFSDNARACFEEIYTPERNKEQLLSIYQSIIKNHLLN
jgi:glycosyltransferase involved in cell wall biosynthesis